MIKKGNSIKTHFCDLFFVFLYMRKQLPGKKIQAFVFLVSCGDEKMDVSSGS